MARKGKPEKTRLDAAVEKATRKAETGEHWRDRGAFPINTTAPTTLCTEHVPHAERPLECAKCGKPLALVQRNGERRFVERADSPRPTPEELDLVEGVGKAIEAEKALFRDKTDEWEERIDAARASEERFEPPPTFEWRDGPEPEPAAAPLSDDEWSDVVTPEEREAPFAAVLTAEQLEEALEAEEPLDLSKLGDVLDGMKRTLQAEAEPAGYAGMVELSKLWLERAKTMADADGFTVPEFIERLLKRQWIASGGGKRA